MATQAVCIRPLHQHDPTNRHRLCPTRRHTELPRDLGYQSYCQLVGPGHTPERLK
ncbi:hypothetical protein DPMN_153838 [Dreissena polymorpha]|uniref:Uncharacterized protein n=1 Tax=Dreissena polymorpha TaxID=45954 RepID=A0A9D4J9A3_DREPO|nr:hypothetical protein DPMN_153780 [Dreissena polymorpha]KAH3800208.1 hypothetical protein DPMN_153838 [Dreissena polymorpha]